MTDKMNLNMMPEDDRPRERLARLGAAALSNSELMGILIGSGNTRMTAVELMQTVLADCGNSLTRLGRMTIEELTRYDGIGPAKAITILAACELGKRRQAEPAEERKQLIASKDIYEYMRPRMQDLPTEEAWVLLMNVALKPIKAVRVSSGGRSETIVDVRVVLKEALLNNATHIVLCHNHPSDSVKPSKNDNSITMQLNEACKVMDIQLQDHLIVAYSGYYSYKDNGKL